MSMTQAPALVLPGFNVHTTFGVFSIGVEISMVLLGILTLQTYNYFSQFAKDPTLIKVMVGFIYCVQVACTACIAALNYTWTILNYGDPLVLLREEPLCMGLAMFFGGLISPISQSFFAWRISILSRKMMIPSIIWILSFVRLLGNLLCSAVALKSHLHLTPMLLELSNWKWLLILIFSFGWAVDIAVASCLCYYINRERSHALHRTARILRKLIEYIIHTGFVTSIIEFTNLATFLKMPNNLIWISIFLLLPGVFSNSLLASLNARAHLDEQKHVHTTFDLSRYNGGFPNAPAGDTTTITGLESEAITNSLASVNKEYSQGSDVNGAMIILPRTDAIRSEHILQEEYQARV